MKRTATFSDCRIYRYMLWRECDNSSSCEPYICWVMLNPSTSDEKTDDDTTKRVIDFSKKFGYRRCVTVNMIPYCSTDPAPLKTMPIEKAVGDKSEWIKYMHLAMRGADKVVCAWGNAPGITRNLVNPAKEHLVQFVQQSNRIHSVYCLNLTSKKKPAHPLYRPKTAFLQKFALE